MGGSFKVYLRALSFAHHSNIAIGRAAQGLSIKNWAGLPYGGGRNSCLKGPYTVRYIRPEVPPLAYEELTRFAEQLASEARAMLLAGQDARTSAVLKPDRTFVTDLDAAIEARLRSLITQVYPHHGIVGEEEAYRDTDAEWVWILDPIDGTAPFIAGVPVYGTLIALAHRGVPVIGIMDLPVTAERWIGVAGHITTHNGRPVATRPCADLSTAILTASNPDFFTPHEMPALEALKAQTAWRIYGGCCMAYGLLANGRTDIAIDTRLKIYDYAPFKPIIEGAGGVITDWAGRSIDLHSGPRILAAGDPARHREALAIIAASGVGV